MALLRYLPFIFLIILVGGLVYYKQSQVKPPAVAILSEAELKQNLQGKEILVVGGTKGIGYAVVEGLAKRGSKVTFTGRTAPKHVPNGARFVKNDVSSAKAARDLVQKDLKGLTFDTVVLCVGIISRPNLTRTSEGIEEDLAVSYLSRFVISNELIKANALVGRKRVYIMGFPGEAVEPTDIEDINFERTEYKQWPAHMNTVILNEALVHELARRHPDLHVFGLNPGIIQTEIRDNFHGGKQSVLGNVLETIIGLAFKSAEQYVERYLIHLISSPELSKKSAICFNHGAALVGIGPWMSDSTNRLKAWESSNHIVSKVLGTSY